MEKSVNIRICFTQNVQDTEFSDNFIIITPYIRMLDSDWLIAMIFFLQIQALHCEFAEFLLHVGVFA